MICVNSVEVCPKSVTLKVGEWYYDACAEAYPTNADCKEVTWHSEDNSIASVNAWSGYIYAEKIGTTKIYATAADGSGCSDYLTVTVSAAVKVVDVTLSKDYLRMERGTSYTFTATVSPSNATNRTLAWQSSDPYVATVENGMVCGLFEGYTIITATATDGSGASGCCEVDVTNDVLVKSVTVEPSSKTLIEGSSCNLTATVCPSNATNQLLLWRSSDSTVASVHPNTGLVIAQKVGTATIYATSTDTTGVFGTCTVTVKAPTMVECIGVCPETLTLNIGETATLSAEAFPSNATNKMIRWTSDDCNIADVDAVTGCVTAKAVGTTYICANAQDGSGVSACCEVTVTQEHNALKTIKRCYVRLNTSGTTASILEKPNDQGELHDVILEINDTVYLLDKEPFLDANGGSWYRILYDGMMVYVTADDESFETIALPPLEAPTGCNITVSTSEEFLEVRCMPSENAQVRGTFSNGATIILTNETPQNDAWYAVYGQMMDETFSYGWCSGEYLGENVTYAKSVYTSTLTIRPFYSTNSGNLGTISTGDVVTLLEANCYDDETYIWHKILYHDTVAYVIAELSVDTDKPNFDIYTEFVPLAGNSSTETMINNIETCSSSIIPAGKKAACVAIARAMFAEGYKPAFVAGMLSNVKSEGDIGIFESSNYTSHPEKKPDYLVYMDTNYMGTNFYRNNYSGKTIMDVNVTNVYDMLSWLNDHSDHSHGDWRIGSSRVGFGLGCLQWTFSRSFELIKRYREANNNSSTITASQAIEAETALIMDELKQSLYKNIVTNWEAQCSNNLSSVSAANKAASMLCFNYLKPDETSTQASIRGSNAEIIYTEMIK